VKEIFLGSDIILDALLKRPGFMLPAMNVLKFAEMQKLKALTSSIAFVNIHYFLNKYERVNKMFLMKQLRPLVSIINVDEDIIDKALKSGITDFEDAVQYYAALTANVDFIITRNIKDYKQSTIPVLTAEQFLRTLI